MMIRGLIAGSASAALHLAAIGFLLLIRGAGAEPAMFIDLVANLTGESRRDAPAPPRSPSIAHQTHEASPRTSFSV
ncbi:MAG: hypothetical protein C5B48_10395, partial [Candidatus Rokuibacteriota bacterium]